MPMLDVDAFARELGLPPASPTVTAPLPAPVAPIRGRERALRDQDITALAFDKLTERLTAFGNVLTPEHRQALYCVLMRFTHLATGHRSGRWGYAMPCGSGKTEAAKAWCWALWKLQKPYSVAISASKVEALCEIKRGLLDMGVPESAVGLIHHYQYNPDEAARCRATGEQMSAGVASLPATTGNETRQIVLLTHNKLRGQREGERLPSFNGQPRSLLIYDESLLISDTWTLSMIKIDQAKGYLEPIIKRQADVAPDLRDAFAYTTTCIDILDAELAAQRDRSPQTVNLPALTNETQERMIRALKADEVKPLRQLLTFSQFPMRAVATNSGGGYCWYELAIPHDLQSVCVLDASLVIRHLPKIGDRLKTDPAFQGDIKTNHRVEVAQMYWRSGRRSMETAFEVKKEHRLVSKEVIEVVRGIPETEGVIIWSFKHRPERRRSPDILTLLKEDLAAEGIDIHATIDTPDGKRPRFAFLTWGNETSTNDYAHCSNVIMAGVLHRDDIDLAANVIGQKDNLLADYGDLHSIKRSEIAHCVYQALSRGSCRRIVDGEAMPMKAWIVHLDDTLEDTIRTAMPGVKWTEWQPKFIQGVASRKTKTLAKMILSYLETQKGTISTRALKIALDLKNVPARTFTDAVTALLKMTDKWELAGRSLRPVVA